MSKKENKLSKSLVWILMAMLIVGLAGFGATNFTGGLSSVGTVGKEEITVDQFAREFQAEIRATEAQLGQPVTIEMARSIGLERRAISRLVALAALNHETAEMGLSIGDENLLDEITQIQAFQGVDGSFDREAYRFALERIGMTEAVFENDLRSETARTLLQGAIVSGVSMPAQMTDILVDFIGARRAFTWAALSEADLEEPVGEPTEPELQSFYDDNVDLFRLPETKVISYAILMPDMILDSVEVEQEAMQALYDERVDEYNVPERRLVERLAFADEAAANDALAQLEVGGTTFEQLVSDRGLSMIDVDLGDAAMADLGDAGEAVFTAEIGNVIGPLPSPLGPALFRVNGFVAARFTSFEDAEPELRDELAGDRARRVVESQAEDLNDLLAGGATLEELAAESDMELRSVNWFAGSEDGIAAYEDFRVAASALQDGDFPEILFLNDGSIVAMRLDDTLPERPEPFDDAQERVAELWTEAEIEKRLTTQAERAVETIESGGAFDAAGLNATKEDGRTRSDFVSGAPFLLMSEVFEMEPGEVRIVSGDGGVTVVQLDDILPPDETDQTTQIRDGIATQMDQALANALYQAFASDVQFRASPTVDQRAIDAILAGYQQ